MSVLQFEKRCLVIPAIKKSASIPDQLIKKLAGRTLIERCLDTARACAAGSDVIVLTDSEEIGLICERAQVRHVLNPAFRFQGPDIASQMRELLASLAVNYDYCIILNPDCPLVTWVDVEDAWKKFIHAGVGNLVTVKNVRQRLWHPDYDNPEYLLSFASGNDSQKDYLVESGAIIILDLGFLRPGGSARTGVVPFFLNDHSLEIQDYQDWWICERLLERRHVVFVVAGYPAIGMGHVFRALMLAHEISAHKITFVCTRQSELAVESVASRDYHVKRQGRESLLETVLAQRPDLVINDFLNTKAEYIGGLRSFGIPCVNFEDEGPGAALASLVINALADAEKTTARIKCGPEYFCLRDEFVNARRNPLRHEARVILITFGGTDQHNCTRRVLNIVEPICRAFGMEIRIVAGPGYAHKDSLEKRLQELDNPKIKFSWATNIMSRMMEGADLAICSAGRTVYELAHMRVPGIVLATHEREAGHKFARPKNGFAFAGIMTHISDTRIRNMFLAMLKQDRRARYWERENKLSFAGNKERVVGLLQDQLEKSEDS